MIDSMDSAEKREKDAAARRWRLKNLRDACAHELAVLDVPSQKLKCTDCGQTLDSLHNPI